MNVADLYGDVLCRGGLTARLKLETLRGECARVVARTLPRPEGETEPCPPPGEVEEDDATTLPAKEGRVARVIDGVRCVPAWVHEDGAFAHEDEWWRVTT